MPPSAPLLLAVVLARDPGSFELSPETVAKDARELIEWARKPRKGRKVPLWVCVTLRRYGADVVWIDNAPAVRFTRGTWTANRPHPERNLFRLTGPNA